MTTSLKERNKLAKQAVDNLTKLDGANTSLYWERARWIYFLKNDNLFKYLYGDDGYNSWNAFCRERKMVISSSQQKYSNWKFYVEKHKFDISELQQFDTQSLYYISLSKKDDGKATIREWMEKSTELTREDLVKELKGIDCKHEHTHEENKRILVCDDCKKKVMELNAHGRKN